LLFDVFASLPDSAGGLFETAQFERISDAPSGIVTFGGKPDTKPVLLFPPNGAELAVEGFGDSNYGLTLTARAPTGLDLSWYVDGKKILPRRISGQTVWHPAKPGFYKVSVVDGKGATTSARVRVMAIQSGRK